MPRKVAKMSSMRAPSQRAYEASATGRRLGEWDAPALSPTRAATTELDLIRRRSRAATRNNPWISKALESSIATIVGTGIIPRPQTKNKKFNKDLLELWGDYSPLADLNSAMGAYGIQYISERAVEESGEVFIRIIRKRADKNLPVPLQFQVVEADLCPLSLNRKAPNGNEIISGIEVDKNGTMVAVWLYQRHPSEGLTSLNDVVRVAAANIIHLFKADRPGQLRGVPKGVQSMVRAHVFDKYDDAELGRKEARANFTGIIKRPDYGPEDYKFDPISGEPISSDDNDVPILEMETGTFPSLLPGEDLTLFTGDDAGRGYKDYQHYQLLASAAGWGIPYQHMTGDYTEINDRLWRAIMNQYQREVEQYQHLSLIPQLCRRMWNEFVQRAIISGAIDYPITFADNPHERFRCHHHPQAQKHIHPVQDVQAKVMEIDNRLNSRQKVIDETKGESIEEIDRQIAEDAARDEKLNLKTEDSENVKST